MSFDTLGAALLDDLARPSFLFSDAQRRRPLLARYPSLTDVLAALAERDEAQYPERDALTRALLEEYQIHGHCLWAQALLAAYSPMLRRLQRRCHRKGGVSCDEAEQLVVSAFLEALCDFPLASLQRSETCKRLRELTENQVTNFLRRQNKERKRFVHFTKADFLEHEDEHGAFSSPWPGCRPHPGEPEDDAEEMAHLLLGWTHERIPSQRLELIVETLLKNRSLRAFVDERYARRSARARETVYEKLKQQRQRTRARLQALLRTKRTTYSSR